MGRNSLAPMGFCTSDTQIGMDLHPAFLRFAFSTSDRFLTSSNVQQSSIGSGSCTNGPLTSETSVWRCLRVVRHSGRDVERL